MDEKIEILDVLTDVLLSYKNVLALILEFYFGKDPFNGISLEEIIDTYLTDPEDPDNPRITYYKPLYNFSSIFEVQSGFLFPVYLGEKKVLFNICVGQLEDGDIIDKILSSPKPPLSVDTCLLLNTEVDKIYNLWIICNSSDMKNSTFYESLEVECNNFEETFSKKAKIDFCTTFLNSDTNENEFYDFLYSYLTGNMLEAYSLLESFGPIEITEEQISLMLVFEYVLKLTNEIAEEDL